MKASETKFQPIIEGTKQYIVPLFQRAYSWDKKEWEVLWNDLVDLCNDNNKKHFMGSIVTTPVKSAPEGVATYLLIDGQQRLTTIFILLALLRDLAKSAGDEELSNEINQVMLVNPFKKEDEYFKLMPTQVDRNLFKKLMRQEPLEDQSLLYRCYHFFDRKIKGENIAILSLKEAITSRLSVVSIVLDNDDNPNLVFESLNAKGRSLTQADLIKNYLFMRIPADRQMEVYNRYWEPMQKELGEHYLTEFIWHYLIRNGATVKKGEVYFTLKERIEQADALESLKDIANFADYYRKILNPEKELNSAISNALKRINSLVITTIYPFLLNCYDDYCKERISADEFAEILNILENFIVRRFVCSVETNRLNLIFPPLHMQAKEENPADLVDGVRRILQKRRYPSDLEFSEKMRESRLYGPGDRAVRVKFILETLENSHHHKEKLSFDNLSIEHIMPQTLTEWWKNHLGENWEADHDIYLHTLGNLTLTAYNSELSNDNYLKKRQRFIESHLELNHYFSNIECWTRLEIAKRSMALSRLAIKVWNYLGNNQFMEIKSDEATGNNKPKILTIIGQQIPVSSWRDVLEQTLVSLVDIEPELFKPLVKEYPNFIGLYPDRFNRPQKLKNGYYFELSLPAKRIYDLCSQIIKFFGLSVEDWKVETD
jgi:uncharacterized protein with ParB-like and HNH nuclease domain